MTEHQEPTWTRDAGWYTTTHAGYACWVRPPCPTSPSWFWSVEDDVHSEEGDTDSIELAQACALRTAEAMEVIHRCKKADPPGTSPPYEPDKSQDHVSFCTDDAPDDEDAVRLHIVANLDYWIYVGAGPHWALGGGFRASLSGARDPRVTYLVAALYKLGREDLDGAVGAAKAFVDEVDARRA